MRNLYLLIVLLCFGLTAQAQFVYEIIDFDGLSRRYTVYLPTNYDNTTAMPVVMNFHGFGSNSSQQSLYTAMNEVADTAGFIVVYPDGIGAAWNSFGASFPGSSTADDVGFINVMLDQINYDYNIDLAKIYATGMSNGGFMSHYLACELSDRFAAIAGVTGLLSPVYQTGCNPAHAMPVMQIHGTSDSTVAYANGNFGGVQNTIDFWTGFNNCNTTATIDTLQDINTTDSTIIISYSYTGCDSSVSVLLYKVVDGGHTWPGAALVFNPADYGYTNLDVNASAEVWNFFSQYSYPSFRAAGAPTDSAITSIESSKMDNVNDVVRYYPNPMQNQLTVEVLQPGVKQVSLYNVLGEEVISTHGAESGALSLPTAQLQSGVYLLQVQYNNTKLTYKLVK